MTYKILEVSFDENHIFFDIEYTINGKTYTTFRGFRNSDNKTEEEITQHIIDIGNGMEEEIMQNKWQNKIADWFKNLVK